MNVFYLLQNNRYSAFIGWSVWYMPVQSIWFAVWFQFSISSLVLCLVVLSTAESEVLNCLLLQNYFSLQFCQFQLHEFVDSSARYKNVHLLNRLSTLSTYNALSDSSDFFCMKYILYTISMSTQIFPLVIICVEYLFPLFLFQSICFFKFPVNYLYTVYSWGIH